MNIGDRVIFNRKEGMSHQYDGKVFQIVALYNNSAWLINDTYKYHLDDGDIFALCNLTPYTQPTTRPKLPEKSGIDCQVDQLIDCIQWLYEHEDKR